MLKKLVFGALVISLVIGIYSIFSSSEGDDKNIFEAMTEVMKQKDNPGQATFVIFTNGTKRNFSDSMYHNLSSEVFIRAANPEIIKISKEGITWEDFFKSLPMKLASDCLETGAGEKYCSEGTNILKFYLNGEKVNDLLSREISDGDQLLVSYGSETDDQIQLQLSQLAKP